jgi:hypothetical protein
MDPLLAIPYNCVLLVLDGVYQLLCKIFHKKGENVNGECSALKGVSDCNTFFASQGGRRGDGFRYAAIGQSLLIFPVAPPPQ